MNKHRSILYIGGDFRAREALGEVAAVETNRAVSAAHLRNALSEFGTDQFDGDCADRRQNHLDLSVPTLNPERNRPHNFQNQGSVAGLSHAWTTALPL